jgi:hypothetical protein
LTAVFGMVALLVALNMGFTGVDFRVAEKLPDGPPRAARGLGPLPPPLASSARAYPWLVQTRYYTATLWLLVHPLGANLEANLEANLGATSAGGIPPVVLRPVPQGHEAEGPEHRPPTFGQCPDHVLRFGPGTG